jgi:beta-glucosidase
VLIKNEGGVLPFARPTKKVLVAGSLAAKENTGDHGSSRVYAPWVVTPLEGIAKYLGEGVEVVHCDATALDRAKAIAAEADCVIIVAGNDYNDEGEYIVMDDIVEGEHPVVTGIKNQGNPLKALLVKSMIGKMFESYTTDDGSAVGGDRADLSLKPSEVRMVQELAGINPNTVVTLVCGSTIMTSEWDEETPAILYGWYSGMEGGTALARVLFGDVSPSGKLPFTIPEREDDLPYFSSTDLEIEYDLYHGYTLLDRKGVAPKYPFGHGLSYTSFSVGNLAVSATPEGFEAEVTVTNTGDRAGAEVVQLYMGKPDSVVERPVKLLKGFAKVRLEPGSSERVRLAVNRDELSYYSNETLQWVFEPGTYRVYLGTSSDERSLEQADVVVEGG